MKKNPASKSGLFNPRFILAFLLCSFGVCLAMLGFAAAPAHSANSAPNALKPIVVKSLYNGVSPALRDLTRTAPTARGEVEYELRRVKADHPVPADFVDAALQSSVGVLAMPAPNLTFEGINQADGCGGCIPPDTNGAVGPTQYVQMVNSAVAVFDKSGTRLMAPTAINALWSGLPGACKDNNNGDPVVVYDQLADRWMLSQFAVPSANYHECIAISKTSDATGAYYVYDFPLSTTKFEDYPHFGLWPDGYYMSTHEFNVAGTAYLGAGAWAFERPRMLSGLPAQMIYFSLGNGSTSFGGQLPATLDGYALPPAGAPNYFAQVDNAADIPPIAALRLWKFHVDWTTPANSSFGLAGQPNSITPVTDFTRPNCSLNGTRAYVAGCVPQAGDPSQLDPIGDRLMYRLAYRNFGDHESLVLNHMAVADATTGQMGPRWYEVRDPGGSPTIFQQSTLGPSSQTDVYRFVGSIAMDRAGDMAMGYSTSSLTTFPSIAYSGRLAGDPINTLAQGEAQMFAGTGPQRGELFAPQTGRWGDYSDLTVDPVDDCTFWYTTEYFAAVDAPTGAWHTRVGSFKFPQCTPRPVGTLRGTIIDSSSGNPIAGASVSAGGYTATANGSGFYQFSPLAPGGYTATASAVGYFSSSPTAVTVTDGAATTQNFALVRNLAVPTPTPAPLPTPIQNVNPPVLNDPGATITTSNYTVTWSPAEVTAGLASYVIEESTDYVNPLFDNADGTALPGQAGSLWVTSPSTDPWRLDPTYRNSIPNSFFGDSQGSIATNPSLTLASNITIPNTVGSARLTFYSRYFNDPDDTGNVEISTNSGSTWSLLKALNAAPTTPPADTRVQSHEVDLTAYRGAPFKLRFRFNGGSLIYFLIRSVGWWVDDINADGATWTQVGTTGPGTTSLNITNKPNGHYYYRVRGVYSGGSPTTNSNVQDIIVNSPALPPQLASVGSRKTHGVLDFDVDLPLTGTRGIECRSGGANNDHKLIFTFTTPVTNCGTASSGTASSGPNSNQCTVNLTGVTNGQYLQVNLNGVVSGSGGVANITGPSAGFLLGDTTKDGTVNSGDIAQTKSQSGTAVSASNFREDVTVDGNINSGDIALVKSKSGTALPTSP